jgi:glucan biosynthesis protein C
VPQKNAKIQRMYHFDVLRSVMLLLIVLTHATHAYDPTHEWIPESPDRTWLAPVLASVSVFSMPGFYMISSLLSIFLIRKRGYRSWAKGRMLRVYVPLLSGIAILSPMTIYIASLATQLGAAGETSSPFTGNLATDLSVIDRRWIGHLWFLSTLGIFTLIAWLGFVRFQLMDRLSSFASYLVNLNARIDIWWPIVLFIGVWEFSTKAFMYVIKLWIGYEPALISILNVDTLLGFFPLFLFGLLLGVNDDLRSIMFKVTPFRTTILAVGFAVFVFAAGLQNDEWRIARKFIRPAGNGQGRHFSRYQGNVF